MEEFRTRDTEKTKKQATEQSRSCLVVSQIKHRTGAVLMQKKRLDIIVH
jgi:hypothetical protein